MSSQIIESQKPMLVEQAVQFETVVKNVKGASGKKQQSQLGLITWDNAEELEQ